MKKIPKKFLQNHIKICSHTYLLCWKTKAPKTQKSPPRPKNLETDCDNRNEE